MPSAAILAATAGENRKIIQVLPFAFILTIKCIQTSHFVLLKV